MSRPKDPRVEEQKKLIRKLRKHPQYLKWKEKVLKRDGWSKKDKGIQVHHLVEISTLLHDNDVKSVEAALKCETLWLIDLGITLTRGEHFIMTKLRRYKYLTEGFITILETWLNECKYRPRKCSKEDIHSKRK